MAVSGVQAASAQAGRGPAGPGLEGVDQRWRLPTAARPFRPTLRGRLPSRPPPCVPRADRGALVHHPRHRHPGARHRRHDRHIHGGGLRAAAAAALQGSDRLVVALHGPDAIGAGVARGLLDYRARGAVLRRAGGRAGVGRDARRRRSPRAHLGDAGVRRPARPARRPAGSAARSSRARISPAAIRSWSSAHGLWQRHFGGDPSSSAATVTIDGRPFTVVGVMPPTFRFAPFWQTRAELWAPLSLTRGGTIATVDRCGCSAG